MTKRQLDNPSDLLRDKGLLHVALSCVYLHSNDHVVLSLGQPHVDYKHYRAVLSKQDVYGRAVLGYMTQGRVLDPPVLEMCETEERYRSLDHDAACVHTEWLFAHMLLLPEEEHPADFQEAVRLAERASDTMLRISLQIREAALAVAERLGIEVTDGAPLVPEHPLHVAIPRLPYNFKQLMGRMVDRQHKSEARIAFETEIMDVFSFGIRVAERWSGKVMLCTTGLRKRYNQMTAEERASSGSVVLGHIMSDLLDDELVESAVRDSLVAARALEHLGLRVHKACETFHAT